MKKWMMLLCCVLALNLAACGAKEEGAADRVGAQGALVWDGQQLYELAPYRAVGGILDTTGAGDAFWGGFLSTLCEAGVTDSLMLSENLILSAMKRGCAAGALCVKQKGAMESLPTSEALNNFLKELSQ